MTLSPPVVRGYFYGYIFMALIQAKKDLTRGSMTGNLLTFAVPFLLANLFQALYAAVDLWVVGKFGGGKIGTAAVSNGGEVMHLVMSFLMGLTTGATVLIGQYFGAGDKRNTNRSIAMTLLLSLAVGIALTAFMVPFTPVLTNLLNVPAEAVPQTIEYMRISAWGIVFIVGYNALSAIFRGFGNSTAPLFFVGIACAINVIGDLLLVAWLDMGPAGAAYATIASQALSMIFALIYLKCGNFGFKFALPYFKPVWGLAWKYIKVGVPIGLQGILISLSFVLIISIVNEMGGDDSATAAAYGIVNRINGFTFLPAVSFSMAMAALTAQNIGAGKPVRAVKTLTLAITYTMLVGIFSLALLQLIPEKLIAIFIDRDSAGADEVIRQGALYARSFSWEYILVPIVFCTNGFFNGCGRAFFSMSNNLIFTFLVRVPVSLYFSRMDGATLYHVGFAAPLASFSSNIVALIYLFSGRWKTPRKKKELPQK